MKTGIFERLKKRARELGGVAGESAAQWAQRDPKAASQFGRFIEDNKDGITRAIARELRR